MIRYEMHKVYPVLTETNGASMFVGNAVAVVEFIHIPGLHITGARIPGIVDMRIGLHGKTMGKTMGKHRNVAGLKKPWQVHQD